MHLRAESLEQHVEGAGCDDLGQFRRVRRWSDVHMEVPVVTDEVRHAVAAAVEADARVKSIALSGVAHARVERVEESVAGILEVTAHRPVGGLILGETESIDRTRETQSLAAMGERQLPASERDDDRRNRLATLVDLFETCCEQRLRQSVSHLAWELRRFRRVGRHIEGDLPGDRAEREVERYSNRGEAQGSLRGDGLSPHGNVVCPALRSRSPRLGCVEERIVPVNAEDGSPRWSLGRDEGAEQLDDRLANVMEGQSRGHWRAIGILDQAVLDRYAEPFTCIFRINCPVLVEIDLPVLEGEERHRVTLTDDFAAPYRERELAWLEIEIECLVCGRHQHASVRVGRELSA